MADVKFTPRDAAELLSRLDESMQSVAAAKQQVLNAMADRRTPAPRREPQQHPAKRRRALR